MYVTDFTYHLEEYELTSFPGVMINECWLEVAVERLDGQLDFYIEGVQLERPDGKVEVFRKGSWLFDAMVPEIYKNEKISDFIREEMNEHV